MALIIQLIGKIIGGNFYNNCHSERSEESENKSSKCFDDLSMTKKLTSKVQSVEECDATGDAMKVKAC